VSMLAAVIRPSGVAWLWILMKPGVTNNPVASIVVGRRALRGDNDGRQQEWCECDAL
jgi:hypothetical protein